MNQTVRKTYQRPHLAVLHRTGPAFLPMAVAESLGASLVAQTQTAVGDVLNAIQRKCLLDLMPAWARLQRISGVTPQDQRRTSLRRDWFWTEAHDAVVMALCYSQTESASVRWAVADMLIRGEAAEAAIRTEATLLEWTETPEIADMLRVNLEAYRACADGRV